MKKIEMGNTFYAETAQIFGTYWQEWKDERKKHTSTEKRSQKQKPRWLHTHTNTGARMLTHAHTQMWEYAKVRICKCESRINPWKDNLPLFCICVYVLLGFGLRIGWTYILLALVRGYFCTWTQQFMTYISGLMLCQNWSSNSQKHYEFGSPALGKGSGEMWWIFWRKTLLKLPIFIYSIWTHVQNYKDYINI